MNIRLGIVFKWCWVISSISLLLFTLAIYDGTPETQDAELVLLYGMLFLCFPASQLVAIIFWLVVSFIEIAMHQFTIPTSYSLLVIEWLIFFTAGYTQWFVLLPWLWRKWRERCSESPHGQVLIQVIFLEQSREIYLNCHSLFHFWKDQPLLCIQSIFLNTFQLFQAAKPA